MPYNPGVQDISGQLRGQGMQMAAQGISDGIRQFAQNQMMAKASMGRFSAALAANPELGQMLSVGAAPAEQGAKPAGMVSPEVVKAFGKFQTGKTSVSDAATLAAFADAYTQQKQEQQQAQLRNLQLQQLQNVVGQQQQELSAMQRLKDLNQFTTPQTQSTGAPGGAPQALLQGRGGPSSLGAFTRQAPTGVGVLRPGVQQQMASAAQNSMDRYAADVLRTTGRLPTPEDMSRQQMLAAKPQPIIAESMTALENKYPPQKFDYKVALLPDGRAMIPDGVVNTRAPGDERQPFQLGSAMGDKTGKFLGYVTFDQRSGKAMLETPEGQRSEIPKDARPVTATAMQRHVPDINSFRKMKADVTDAEISLRNMDRYLESVDSADIGIARLADTFTAGIKTLSGGKDPLNTKEIAAKAAQGQLQGLLGANRTNVVGGGVMTEQDAIRVIQRLGGEPGALQNPELVRKAIKELYTDRYQQYQDDLLFFNNAVDDYYGERGHKRLEGTKFSPKLTGEPPKDQKPPAPSTSTPAASGWSGDKEKRLQELRKKLGK